MSQYFPKPFRSFGGNIDVKDYLSNFATKTDLKNVIHVDTLNFALKTNVANLTTEVDKSYIEKLVPVTDYDTKLVSLKRTLLIKSMTNILLLQSSIS